MANTRARIGVILGSSNDLPFIKRCEETLDSFGEPHELIVASAHRTPDLARHWAEGAMERGLRAIVAAAGAAAALPGVVAAHTTLPVVGLPLDTSPLRGTDSLYAMAQMPPGVPVATVGINCAENAALLALEIVATADPALRGKLDEYRRKMRQKIADANEELYRQRPHVRPQAPPAGSANAEEASPMAGELDDTRPSFEEPGLAPQVFVPRTTSPDAAGRRLTIDPQRPSIEAIERATDVLLDGGVVALPTDTVYGLAADASRGESVRKLFQIKNRPRERHIPLLIHSPRLIKMIASEMPAELEALVERFWPGALTVVFKKYPGSFQGAASGETVGVRIPNDRVALAVLAMIARPLAVTSANLSGGEPARDADAIEREFGDRVDLLLDAGTLGGGAVSTVLDVSSRPFRILREGAVARADLASLLGDLLQG